MQDFYSFKKEQRASFSYRQFAIKVGVSSPNYLQLVMQGRRNLSNALAFSVADAMQLNTHERNYFVSMVRLDNSISVEEKKISRRELLIASKQLCTKKIPLSQREVLKNWYHLLVRELLTLSDFNPDPTWISKKLRGYLTPQEAELAFKHLVDGGFVVFVNGRWVQQEPVLSTGDSFDEALVVNHHRETLKLWSKNILDFTESERELGLINIPIAKEKIPELQRRMREFQSEIIGWLKDEDKPDQVVQLGVYMFATSEPNE